MKKKTIRDRSNTKLHEDDAAKANLKCVSVSCKFSVSSLYLLSSCQFFPSQICYFIITTRVLYFTAKDHNLWFSSVFSAFHIPSFYEFSLLESFPFNFWCMFLIGEDTIRYEGTYVIPELFGVDKMYGRDFIESSFPFCPAFGLEQHSCNVVWRDSLLLFGCSKKWEIHFFIFLTSLVKLQATSNLALIILLFGCA